VSADTPLRLPPQDRTGALALSEFAAFDAFAGWGARASAGWRDLDSSVLAIRLPSASARGAWVELRMADRYQWQEVADSDRWAAWVRRL